MAKVLMKAGAAVRELVMMYKLVVRTIFLYRSEIWVVTGAMLMVTEGFRHRLARNIAGKTARNSGDGGWEWPTL